MGMWKRFKSLYGGLQFVDEQRQLLGNIDHVFEPRTEDFRLSKNDKPDVRIGKVLASGRCPVCGHKRLREFPRRRQYDPIFVFCDIQSCVSGFTFFEHNDEVYGNYENPYSAECISGRGQHATF
jgi:hypothetical protein